MVTVRVKGVSRVCQGLCSQLGDKQLPGIVAIRESSHKFKYESNVWWLKTILTDTKNSLGVGKG